MPLYRRHPPRPRPPRPPLLPTLALTLLALTPASRAEPPADSLEQRVRALLIDAAGSSHEARVAIQPFAAQLPPCTDPQPFLPHGAPRLPGRVAVGVRCGDGTTRYLQASVALSGEYPVTRRALSAGEVLSVDLLELRRGDLGSLPRNALLDLDQALGKALTRPLPQGSPLPGNALRAVPLVERGARVRVEARAGGFVASREGTALDSGGLDEEVRVRTEGGILRARVKGRNLLAVDF
ncbi:flagellar basal body P-ring formation chaperone FlgA [Pseudomonas stutzeri]|nr:flagellar basal body P-ring formation chaperone FlgA [Stutzerimonas stutzeri]